ncbi:MAG: GTP-dependent dephospho-CoA kinase family protein [Methanomicrobiales archaeon]|nr:GTP-dependent dephospho-CoA kinase family protein [Methanomicrobiales archaeon]MDD1670864.1 GTP-dependent dephospho-CoA kinase family protein [Methanomicrobiales archaeon]
MHRRLPEAERSSLQRPFGEVFPNIRALLPRIRGRTVYAVGDVVTYNLLRAGVVPRIAIIDGHTMRAPCTRIPDIPLRRITARNPPGTISDDLVRAIREALASPPALIFVEGEEDLAVLPLVLAAPEGAVVLYGQPGEGVVLRKVNREAKGLAAAFVDRFVHEENNREGGEGTTL